MAEAILSELVRRRGIAADIASVGLLPGRAPVPTETQDALRAIRYDSPRLAARRSRQLSDADIDNADLVLGLARDHVREIVVRMPSAWDRTFTLKELVRRGEAVGPRPPGQELSSWLAAVSLGRTRADLLGSSNADDVDDPIGGPPSAFEQTATEIKGLCESLSSLVWP
jgi:protein-tyrosine phosphatase